MNQTAQKVLSWLSSLPDRADKRIVSGQHCGGASFAPLFRSHIEGVHRETGKWIGLLGIDFGWMDSRHETDWPQAKPLIVDWWNSGGLVTILWHMPNPVGEGARVDLVELSTPGTALNAAWMVEVEEKTGWLSELRDAGVIVIWRPFMEMNMSRNSGWWKGSPPVRFGRMWAGDGQRHAGAEHVQLRASEPVIPVSEFAHGYNGRSL
jgi:mannan endo-1,4-beta-mannosidase